jgi:putative phosphoesterase
MLREPSPTKLLDVTGDSDTVMSMKVMVLSDTHGNYPLALKAVESALPVDGIVHVGDITEDALIIEEITGQNILKVMGNCDPTGVAPRELEWTVAGRRFLITHGDRYQVKSGLDRLLRRALAADVHVVLYGHTHVASVEIIDGILFVNPGYFDKEGTSGSYAVVNVTAGAVTADLVSLTGRAKTYPSSQHPHPQL